MFQADGVVMINGRPGVNAMVTFAASPKPGRIDVASRGRAVPPSVLTDKLGRWVQDGFADGIEYLATTTALGVIFRPDRSPLDVNRTHLRTQGTAATFSATGVARTT